MEWFERFEHLQRARQDQRLNDTFSWLPPRNEPPYRQQAADENGGEPKPARIIQSSSYMQLRQANNRSEQRHERNRKDREPDQPMSVLSHQQSFKVPS